MSSKNSPIYTKTFGGKIWKNLHSDPPDNNLGKKFKVASPKITHQKLLNITSYKNYQKKIEYMSNFKSWQIFPIKIFGQYLPSVFCILYEVMSSDTVRKFNHFVRGTNLVENTEFVREYDIESNNFCKVWLPNI